MIFDNANDDADPNINPDDHFDLADEPQESFLSPAHEEDEAAVDLPLIIIGKKKSRLIRSKNKTYAAVLRTTRLGYARSGYTAYVIDELDEEFTAPKSRSRLTDELDEEFTAPKNRNGTHDFSFDNSYQDSNSEEDDDYVDEKVKNDKSAYHAALYAGAKSNPTDPETLEEAKASPDWPKWKAAISSEYRALRRKKTWTLMKRNQVPKGQKVLHGRLVFKKKSNKEGTLERFKVRWVVKGFAQVEGRDYHETYASVCKTAAWKVVLAMAANQDLEVEQMDVDTAFLNSDTDTNIYVDMPPGWQEMGNLLTKEDVVKLLKALYGLKQAPRLWQQHLAAALKQLGFDLLESDDCLYFSPETRIIIVTYIDDFLIVARSITKINKLKEQLADKFAIKELGPVEYFVGVRIVRDRANRKIYLCQDAYIRKIVDRFGMANYRTIDTPMATGAEINMVPFDGIATKAAVAKY